MPHPSDETSHNESPKSHEGPLTTPRLLSHVKRRGGDPSTERSSIDDEEEDGRYSWTKRFAFAGLIMAGIGATTYWVYRSLFLSDRSITTKPSNHWTPTSWTRLIELLQLRRVRELVFRDDAVFFRDNVGGAYVTGILPGSSSWLFDQVKHVPLLLSVPFARHLALLPFHWTLSSLSNESQQSSMGAEQLTEIPPLPELPDFNSLEAKMTAVSMGGSREPRNDQFDNLWSSFIVLTLVAFCLNTDWSEHSAVLRRFFNPTARKLKKEKTTFADVAGHDNTKQELQQMIQFLNKPEQFIALGARMPRGVLLEGRTGTGKTLLVRAVAGEANVPFFYVPASSFVEIYVGQGASRVRQFFLQARKNAPCVIFIDEVDALGTSRTLLGSSNQEYVQTLNQLLTEMDGLERSFHEKGDLVIVIAATNRYDALDEALTRPGRFDRVISLSLPTLDERESQLWRIMINSILMSVKLRTVAELTEGWTGAELECLFNEAALLAARSGAPSINSLHVSQVLADLHKRRHRATERQTTGHNPVLDHLERLFERPVHQR